MQEHALCFPERLRLNEVDFVFRFVPFAFIRIELEFHAVDLTKAPASPASHAASTSVHALHPNVARSPIIYHKRLMIEEKSKFVSASRLNQHASRVRSPDADANRDQGIVKFIHRNRLMMEAPN